METVGRWRQGDGDREGREGDMERETMRGRQGEGDRDRDTWTRREIQGEGYVQTYLSNFNHV